MSLVALRSVDREENQYLLFGITTICSASNWVRYAIIVFQLHFKKNKNKRHN